MAIANVVERRGYDHSYSFGKYAPDREFTRYFWAYSDTKSEDPLVVRAAAGIPQPADVHPTDTGCIVQRVRVRRDEEVPTRWEVEVTYSNQTRDVEKDPPPDVTTYERVTISTRQGQRLIERDIDGALIKNTAGDLILGVSVPWNALAMQIEQYVTSTPDYYSASQYINAINNGSWRGVPAYFAKIASINFEPAKLESLDVWRRTTVVEIAHLASQPWGWRERVLNAGLRQKISGQLKQIRDDLTQGFVTHPVPLKSDGTKAGPLDSPYYLDFKVYPEVSFSVLGI